MRIEHMKSSKLFYENKIIVKKDFLQGSLH